MSASWLAPPEYNPDDICPICQDRFGTTTAVYKTNCKHIFHNNCLLKVCESQRRRECPLCRKDIDEDCGYVRAFKENALGYNEQFIDENRHIMDIYNNGNKLPQGGRKHKRAKKTKRRLIKKRISSKNRCKKTKYRKRK